MDERKGPPNDAASLLERGERGFTLPTPSSFLPMPPKGPPEKRGKSTACQEEMKRNHIEKKDHA